MLRAGIQSFQAARKWRYDIQIMAPPNLDQQHNLENNDKNQENLLVSNFDIAYGKHMVVHLFEGELCCMHRVL